MKVVKTKMFPLFFTLFNKVHNDDQEDVLRMTVHDLLNVLHFYGKSLAWSLTLCQISEPDKPTSETQHRTMSPVKLDPLSF